MENGWKSCKDEKKITTMMMDKLIGMLLPKELLSSNSIHSGTHKRISIVAMSLQVLGEIGLLFPLDFIEYFNLHYEIAKQEEILNHIFKGIKSEDPLLKGKTIFFSACLLKIHLQQQTLHDNQYLKDYCLRKEIESNTSTTTSSSIINCSVINIKDRMEEIVQGAQDSSSVTSQESCNALEMMLPLLGTSRYSELILVIVANLTNYMHPYWLIRSKIVSLLAKLDFKLINYLEKTNIRSIRSLNETTLYTRDSLQSRVLSFITRK